MSRTSPASPGPLSTDRRPRVVIVGAGFAGLEIARRLRRDPVDILLIDRSNFHTFQPLLYQVATAALEPEEIAQAVRGIFHKHRNFEFRLGTVEGVDWQHREVILADPRCPREPYDFLILAAGAETASFGVAGVEEHAFGLKTLEEAIELRGHVMGCFEATNIDAERIDRGVLNFVVVGGGPTGVEMAGGLKELFTLVLEKDFHHLDAGRARVLLVEAGPRLLTAFPESQGEYARGVLQERGVEVLTERAITEVREDAVVFKNGEVLPTRTVLWAAGIKANRLADSLGVETGRAGRIRVEADLSLPGRPEVFAVGDLAAATDEEGNLYPQLAPAAVQAGRHVVETLRRRMSEQPSEPFRYKDPGTMATIGRSAAVAQFAGLKLRGFLAWLAWALVHLMLLIGFRNRILVYVNWIWNYFTYDRSARLILFTEDWKSRVSEDPKESGTSNP